MTTIPRDCTSLQAERTARAKAVAGEYAFERVQSGMWVTCHPSELDRCYVIELTGSGVACSCPDYSMSVGKIGIECKHIVAAQQLFPDEAWLKKLAAPAPRLPVFELSTIPKGVDPFTRE